jgi:hypothetical protein
MSRKKKKGARRPARPSSKPQFSRKCQSCLLEPANEIRELVRDAIESHIDQTEWRRLQKTEQLERQSIRSLRLAPILNGNGEAA